MDKPDINEIISKNPHLDRDSLDALQKYIEEIAPHLKTRYRLAPLGTHRATIGLPDPATGETKRERSYPGF